MKASDRMLHESWVLPQLSDCLNRIGLLSQTALSITRHEQSIWEENGLIQLITL